MDEMLNKIYRKIVIYERETVQANRMMDDEVLLLMDEYKQQLQDVDQDTLKELLFSALPIAEQTGFRLGVRFALKFLSYLSN